MNDANDFQVTSVLQAFRQGLGQVDLTQTCRLEKQRWRSDREMSANGPTRDTSSSIADGNSAHEACHLFLDLRSNLSSTERNIDR